MDIDAEIAALTARAELAERRLCELLRVIEGIARRLADEALLVAVVACQKRFAC
jgi:hypothetical protein